MPGILSPSLREKLAGGPEAAATMATSLLSMPGAGYAGLLTAGIPEEERPMGYYVDGEWRPSVVGNVPMPAAAAVQRAMTKGTYVPRGEEGQGTLQHAGTVMEELMYPLTSTVDYGLLKGTEAGLSPIAMALPLTALTAGLETVPFGRAKGAVRSAARVAPDMPPSGFGGIGDAPAPIRALSEPAVPAPPTRGLDADLLSVLEARDPNVTQGLLAADAGQPMPKHMAGETFDLPETFAAEQTLGRRGGDVPANDGREVLTRDEFYNNFDMHTDLRGRDAGNAAENAASIAEDGFKRGGFFNRTTAYSAMPMSGRRQSQYAPKPGDYVYLIPSKDKTKTVSGRPMMPEGWKPGGDDGGMMVKMREGEELYDAYVRTLEQTLGRRGGDVPANDGPGLLSFAGEETGPIVGPGGAIPKGMPVRLLDAADNPDLHGAGQLMAYPDGTPYVGLDRDYWKSLPSDEKLRLLRHEEGHYVMNQSYDGWNVEHSAKALWDKYPNLDKFMDETYGPAFSATPGNVPKQVHGPILAQELIADYWMARRSGDSLDQYRNVFNENGDNLVDDLQKIVDDQIDTLSKPFIDPKQRGSIEDTGGGKEVLKTQAVRTSVTNGPKNTVEVTAGLGDLERKYSFPEGTDPADAVARSEEAVRAVESVMYHGGPGSVADRLDAPAFLTSDREGANWFAEQKGGTIGEFEVDVKNPLNIDTRQGSQELIQIAKDAGVDISVTGDIEKGVWDWSTPDIAKYSPYDGTNLADLTYIPAVREGLRRAGYDGLELDDILGNSTIPTKVALDPSQTRRIPREYSGPAYRVEPGFEGGPPRGATAQDVIIEEMDRKGVQHLDEFGIDEKTYDALKDVPAENLVWVGRSQDDLIQAYGPQKFGEHEYPGLFGGDPADISDVSDVVKGGRVIFEDSDGALVLKPSDDVKTPGNTGAADRLVHGPGRKQRGSVQDTGGGKEVLKAQAARTGATNAAQYSERFPTFKAFTDWKKATPNSDPTKREIMYEVLDEQRAKVDAKALERDGRPYGSPKGMSTQRRTSMVRKYADRIERGLDAFPPGYFYEEGRQTLASVAPTRRDQRIAANQIQGTSSQVGPAENANYTIRGRDQFEGGAPINTTIYPNTAREPLTQMSGGQEIWGGYKRDRYGNLLTPEGARPELSDTALMPPNDRWEFRAAGFDSVPTDPKNVAYMDRFRQDAVDIVNKRRADRGERPLTLEEAQEVHWAVIRAETEGRPLALNPPNDQIGGALNRLEYSHTYEATPGTTVGQTLAREGEQGLLDVFNQGGRDPLVESMGGILQGPVKPHIGYWDDQVNLGQTSRSYTSRTDSGGIHPASSNRVRATEAVRSFALGQDAFAGHVFTPISGAKDPKFNGVTVGGKVSEADLKAAIELGAEINPDMVVVHSPGVGIRAWIPGDTSKKAQRQVQDFSNEVGFGDETAFGKVDSQYDELGWSGGNATQDVLNILDEAGADGFPGIVEKADSPETRAVLGTIARKYDDLQAAGLAVPNKKLVDVLRVWADKGLPGVRKMVKNGTAPAAALAVLSGQDGQESPGLLDTL
jgi:hypothetical protein